ncbi:hypothetical protein EMIT0P258_10094 [Pseudomonas sp. IT-P258]
MCTPADNFPIGEQRGFSHTCVGFFRHFRALTAYLDLRPMGTPTVGVDHVHVTRPQQFKKDCGNGYE